MSIYVLSRYRTIGSGRALADAVGATCITPKYSRDFNPEDIIINYGVCNPCPGLVRHSGIVINPPLPVRKAVNKLSSLDTFKNGSVPTLEYCSPSDLDYDWFDTGHTSRRSIIVRTILTGSQGRGILYFDDKYEYHNWVCSNPDKPKLITRYFPKTKEFRVHVAFGKVIHISQKRAMSAGKIAELGLKVEEPDRIVRSYKRGWVFANEITAESTDAVERAAIKAVNSLGLAFGAVDVLATGAGEKVNKVAVCEVNTAPSLDGTTTLASYEKAFKENLYA